MTRRNPPLIDSANEGGAAALAAASAAGLTYVNDSDPGISRLRQGETFRGLRESVWVN